MLKVNKTKKKTYIKLIIQSRLCTKNQNQRAIVEFATR